MIHVPEDFDEADTTFVRSMVPDGALIDSFVAAVSYIDPDTGKRGWQPYAAGTGSLAEQLGLMVMSMVTFVSQAQARAFADDEDDDD